MTKRIFSLLIGVVSIGSPMKLLASGAGSSGGLSLITDGNARLSSLGQAATAFTDDVGAMSYNPALLGTLSKGHASLLYQQGLIEDAYGQFTIGTPNGTSSAWGLSLGYYNGGDIQLFNADGTTSDVNAQTDLTGALSYAYKFGGASIGLTGKVLHSKLIDQVSATAYAADFGLQFPVGSRVRLGAAALNYGSQLKYVEAGDDLPRTVRAGSSISLIPGRSNTTLLLDASYLQNEQILTPAAGLETLIGPMAIRAGYRKSSDVSEFTLGAGFQFGTSSLDYAFGMVNQLDAQHKVSLGMRFGGTSPMSNTFVKKPAPKRNVEQLATRPQESQPQASKVTNVYRNEPRHTLGGERVLRAPIQRQQRRVYVVKPGDTLGSIAQNELGDRRQWKVIYSANKHLIDDPAQIEKGMRIVIP